MDALYIDTCGKAIIIATRFIHWIRHCINADEIVRDFSDIHAKRRHFYHSRNNTCHLQLCQCQYSARELVKKVITSFAIKIFAIYEDVVASKSLKSRKRGIRCTKLHTTLLANDDNKTLRTISRDSLSKNVRAHLLSPWIAYYLSQSRGWKWKLQQSYV